MSKITYNINKDTTEEWSHVVQTTTGGTDKLEIAEEVCARMLLGE